MSTREERAEGAREWMRTYGRDCIGCALGLCYEDHDDDRDVFDLEDDE
jgi:hypothetical protein